VQADLYDVCVAGSGPSGLASAALLARAGFGVAVVAPASRNADTRTVALMQPTVRLLKYLDLWSKIDREAEPLVRLKIVDDTGGFLSAPTLSFASTELGLDAFGWNLPLAVLETALRELCGELGVTFRQAACTRARLEPQSMTLFLDDGTTLAGRFAIAADGIDSTLRASVGIGVERWSYDQMALATRFSHSLPHRGVSTEYHRRAGPLTTVPLTGAMSGLVWLERPARARELLDMRDEAFAHELQAAIHGDLGLVAATVPRGLVPMRGLLAEAFGFERVLLVGEAAHAVPPIGAQGLNMSFRDAATAAELLTGALRSTGTVPRELVAEYGRRRRQDVVPRQAVIHAFNRSLLSDFLPVRLARVAALSAVDRIAFLRRLAMSEGLEPSANLPQAMR
jgi:2-octaprenyl-6-methoxyphenol hydroxylase